MAKKKYPKRPKGISFAGIFEWPHLTEPSYGTEKHPKPDGEYSVNLIGHKDDPKVKAMIAFLKPMHDAAVEAAKEKFKALKVESRKALQKKNGKSGIQVNELYKEVYDEETEEPTGEIKFKFTMRASGVRKKGPKAGTRWHRRPDIFDAQSTKPMKNVPDIWGGTRGRVAYEVGVDQDGTPGYFIPGTGAVGLKLELQAVRILELVSKGQRTANEYGFEEEEEEGGYVHDDDAVTSDDEEEEADASEDADADAEDDDGENPDF